MRSWKHRTRGLRNKRERYKASYGYKMRYGIVSRMIRERALGYDYFESCNWHPCRIESFRAWDTDGDVEGPSLVNGKPNSCSLTHCGVQLFKEDEAFERRDFIVKYGMLPYQLKWVYRLPPDHPRDQVIRGVRGSLAMEEVWGFNKNQATPEITLDGKAWLKETFDVDYDSLTPLTEEEMKETDPY